jgi:hypothetical protein
MRTIPKRIAGLAVAMVVMALAIAFAAPVVAHAAPLAGLAGLAVSGVTNTLGNYNETFFAQEALIQLEKVLGLAGRIHRDFSDATKGQGDTVQVRRPATFTAQDAPSTSQNVTTESIAVTVDKWKEVKFELTEKDLSLTNEKIISDHIRPAAVALADQIDQDLATLYKKIPWHSTLQATPVLGDIGKLRQIMFDNKVPLTDKSMLHYMVDGATELAFLNALAASGMQPNQQDSSLREGSMGRLYGFDVWANQNTPSHTSGVAADATGTIDGINAVGATSMLISAVTAGITVKEGDSFAITGDTQRYVITADATDADGAAMSISFYPALKQATSASQVITIFLGGASKKQTLAFHRNFACLATAPLTDMGNKLGANITTISDPITQLSLRSRIFYMPDSSVIKVALDVLYGFKMLDPNLAVRGDAA